MNETNKASSFLEAINKYAQQQSEEIRHEAEEIKYKAIEKATQEGIRDAYTLIQKEIAVNKAEIVSDIARREQSSKKELFELRNKIVEDVFAEAVEKLIKFTKSDQYVEYLKSATDEINELFDSDSCVLYLSENDSDKEQMIVDAIPNSRVEYDSTIKIGGIKAYCQKISVFADNTLDTMLENQKQWFRENSDLKVV